MVDRPAVPKRLASKLRAVYQKLADARSRVAWGEAEIAELTEYLAYYEADPEQFAEWHYSGHGVDSYPVSTHIGRKYERLGHRKRRVPDYYTKLATIETTAAEAEAYVLEELARMRPNTPGREPWPRAPFALSKLQADEMKSQLAELRRSLKRVEVNYIKETERKAREKAKHAAEMAELERKWAITLAAMPPAKAFVYGKSWTR